MRFLFWSTTAAMFVALAAFTWSSDVCLACSCAPPPSERFALALVSVTEVTDPEAPAAVDEPATVTDDDWTASCEVAVMPFYDRRLLFSCGEEYVYLNKGVTP